MISVAMLRAVFVAGLTLRLLVDMGTPFMPGAFRFDPSESMEAHRTPSMGGAAQAVVPPATPSRTTVDEAAKAAADVRPGTTPHVRWSRFRPLLPRHVLDRGPEALDDH
jgi:hypothetical protein